MKTEIISLHSAVRMTNAKKGIIKTMAEQLLLDDKKHFCAFTGQAGNLSIVREKINKGSLLATIPVKLEHYTLACRTIEDLQFTSSVNDKYCTKQVLEELISCFMDRLTSDEFKQFKKGRLTLYKALKVDTEQRLNLISKFYPNLSVISFRYDNDSICSDLRNQVSFILNNDCVLKNQILVTGFDSSKDFDII